MRERDVGHWFARSGRTLAECQAAAVKSADRYGRPEMAHTHRLEEPCTLECRGFLPRAHLARAAALEREWYTAGPPVERPRKQAAS